MKRRVLGVGLFLLVACIAGYFLFFTPRQAAPSRLTDRDRVSQQPVSGDSGGDRTKSPGERSPAPITQSDFELAGLGVETPADQFNKIIKLLEDFEPLGRYPLGPYGSRYSSNGQPIDIYSAYLSPDRQSIIEILGNPKALRRTKEGMLKLTSIPQREDLGLQPLPAVTRAQIRAAYGEPHAKVITQGDQKLLVGPVENWLYFNPDRSQVLWFTFDPAEQETPYVHIGRYPEAARLHYPALGEVEGVRPLAYEDIALGPLSLHTEPWDDEARIKPLLGAFGTFKPEGAPEGYEFRDGRLIFVPSKSISVDKDDIVTTPRGIRVGSTAPYIETKYGKAMRVSKDSQDASVEYWDYENLYLKLWVSFTLKDGQVTSIRMGKAD